ncbi:hypothetical protein MTR67_047604 [Solanum verrucosum]|uniref:PA domain-containing protein n=1 Tax=Solanum verrucosum TaxID=315347 RepID=A0AAF0UYT9_SOLVR|nr:hypothetical protein MTR67_047604 [Solanum verrucosum]
MMNLWVFWYLSVVCLSGCKVLGNVVLVGKNETLSFEDIEANFGLLLMPNAFERVVQASKAVSKPVTKGKISLVKDDKIQLSKTPSVRGSGKCGTLYVAEPLDACLTLTNKDEPVKNSTHDPFLLIIRGGGCSFEDKVRQAQAAGFKAAIIYNDEYGDLVAMAGNSAGVQIPAVFVSRVSGERLTKYAGDIDVEIWIIPSFENSAWSIMAISFISLLAMSAVLATCFFVRRHRIRRDRPRASRVREFHGMSSRLVKAMPSLIFTSVLEDNCTSVTCAICLEDYIVGDKLRILPCRHSKFFSLPEGWFLPWEKLILFELLSLDKDFLREFRSGTSGFPSSLTYGLAQPHLRQHDGFCACLKNVFTFWTKDTLLSGRIIATCLANCVLLFMSFRLSKGYLMSLYWSKAQDPMRLTRRKQTCDLPVPCRLVPCMAHGKLRLPP